MLKKLDNYHYLIPTTYKKGMQVDGLIYASDTLIRQIEKDQTVDQVAKGVALILNIDMTVKPRAQPSAAGGVLGRGRASVGCADPSPPSIVRRSASCGFRIGFCRWPPRCHCQAPSQARA